VRRRLNGRSTYKAPSGTFPALKTSPHTDKLPSLTSTPFLQSVSASSFFNQFSILALCRFPVQRHSVKPHLGLCTSFQLPNTSFRRVAGSFSTTNTLNNSVAKALGIWREFNRVNDSVWLINSLDNKQVGRLQSDPNLLLLLSCPPFLSLSH
jgi:hypothetical protein